MLIKKSKIQNQGLIHGSMLYNVKITNFANQTTYLNKAK